MLSLSLISPNSYKTEVSGISSQAIQVINETSSNYQSRTVVLSGKAVGVKLYCEGAVVVDFEDIKYDNGESCPAKKAGIKKGDTITSINSTPIRSNYELISTVNQSNGKSLNITVNRNGENKSFNVTPIKISGSNCYKIGVWVRDSCAGIGTLTFIEPNTMGFASLGHGVCDVDTGKLLPVSQVIPVRAEIDYVKKGSKGNTGELIGHFMNDLCSSGKACANTQCGLYGIIDTELDSDKLIEIAKADEIKPGKAKVYTTVAGDDPQYYDIVIEKIFYSSNSKTKCFTVKVCDDKLIETTGGIVRGMSGSPIIQNGKLVGAITHVFVNDPKQGYGIFAENMLNEMNCVLTN